MTDLTCNCMCVAQARARGAEVQEEAPPREAASGERGLGESTGGSIWNAWPTHYMLLA